MKSALVLFLLSVFLSGLAISAPKQTIPQEHQTILKGNDWVPTEQETAKALIVVGKFLNKPKGALGSWLEEIKKIKKVFPKYYVRFWGKKINGKKVIHCNFFMDSFNVEEWKTSYVIVDDGGYYYWNIDYDVESGNCINFSSNGYA